MSSAPDSPPVDAKGGFQLQNSPPSVGLKTGYQLDPSLKLHREETARKLSRALLWILAGGILVHYLCVMVLVVVFKRDEIPKSLDDAFHSWLPVIAGLAGGAVTYYFTKEGK